MFGAEESPQLYQSDALLSRAGGTAGGRGWDSDVRLLGMQGTLPDYVDDAMRRAGISHLLSVSGMHVSMVAAGIALLLGALTSDPKRRGCSVFRLSAFMPYWQVPECRC